MGWCWVLKRMHLLLPVLEFLEPWIPPRDCRADHFPLWIQPGNKCFKATRCLCFNVNFWWAAELGELCVSAQAAPGGSGVRIFCFSVPQTRQHSEQRVSSRQEAEGWTLQQHPRLRSHRWNPKIPGEKTQTKALGSGLKMVLMWFSELCCSAEAVWALEWMWAWFSTPSSSTWISVSVNNCTNFHFQQSQEAKAVISCEEFFSEIWNWRCAWPSQGWVSLLGF